MLTILLCIVFLFSCFIIFSHQVHLRKHNQVNLIGTDYLIQQYIKKSFQKVSLHLLKQSKSKKNEISTKEIQQYEQALIQQTKTSIVRHLTRFVRAQEILQSIRDHLNQNTDFRQLDLFLLPDKIIQENQYYHHLVYTASCVFSDAPLEMDNEASKLFLAAIE